MSLTLAIVYIIGLIYPAYIIITYKKTNERIIRDAGYRITDYKITITILWALALLILLNYFLSNPPELMLAPNISLLSIALFFLSVSFLLLQYKTMKVTSDACDAIKEKLKDIYHYLPKTKTELSWFAAVSVSAGICEEILFRVFLYGYLGEKVHVIIAMLLSNVIFAITHIGSGVKNMVSSLLLGLLFSVVYYYTENIWILVVLHTGIDINTGILGYRVHQAERSR